MNLQRSDQNLVWIHSQMTGLDPERDRLLDVAIVVTSADLEFRVEGPVLVIHQSDDQLAHMDAWNKATHGKNGLTEKVKVSTLSEPQAEQVAQEFISKYVGRQQSPMCGNSVSQDRRFLVKYMPKLESYFHYRNIDVATLRELGARWNPRVVQSFERKHLHQSIAGLHEAIDELRHYREHLLNIGAAKA